MYVTFSISVFNCGLSIFKKRILLLAAVAAIFVMSPEVCVVCLILAINLVVVVFRYLLI